MEIRGRASGLSMNFETGELLVTFATRMPGPELQEQYDKIKAAEDLEIVAKKHRKKRSLDANSYFHVLVGKIADEMGLSKTRCKNILLYRYGQPELLDNGVQVTLKANVPVSYMLEQEFLHCQPCGCKQENGIEVVFYKVFRGSHTFDSKEMSILIDGAVQEAKDLGIETLPPAELERMWSTWQPKD